jgi:hypothetical protein
MTEQDDWPYADTDVEYWAYDTSQWLPTDDRWVEATKAATAALQSASSSPEPPSGHGN